MKQVKEQVVSQHAKREDNCLIKTMLDTFLSYRPHFQIQRHQRVALIHISAYDDCPNLIELQIIDSIFLLCYQRFSVSIGSYSNIDNYLPNY